MEIRNFGISGANSAVVLEKEIPEVVAFRPTLSIVLVGTNDCGNKDALRGTEAFRATLREIYARLGAAGSRIIALTIPPLMDRSFKVSFGEEPFGGFLPESRVRMANAAVVEEAARAGAALVDLHAAFSATDLESVYGYLRHRRNYDGVDDGCHPTAEGYRKMAFLVHDKIRALGWDVSRIACVGDSITYGAYERGAGEATRDGRNYPGLLHLLLEPNDAPARAVPGFVREASIYQLSLRAFTEEGTLAAAARHLPAIAATGATIVYLLPIVEADADEDRAHWSARQRASGCENPRNPYRISDFYRIDPEYGDEADLADFVRTAHANGLRVILDLVYYHAGPTFAKRHPDFVRRGEDGTAKDGQWCFPELDFDNPALREYLWDNMVHFVEKFDVDGYRCDVGDAVPLDFWEEGRRRVERVKPDVFMLCEGVRPDGQLAAFDANYCFANGLIGAVLRRDMPAADLALVVREWEARMPRGARLLRNHDNHDIANDQYDARFERLYGPCAGDLLLAFDYTMGGIPFVYCGAEFNDCARHSIFARKGQFTVDRSGDHRQRRRLLAELARIHRSEPALLETQRRFVGTGYPAEVLAFVADAPGGKGSVFVALNFSAHPLMTRPEGVSLEGAETLLAERAEIAGGEVSLGAYGFAILRLP